MNGSLRTGWSIFPIVILKVQGQGKKLKKKKLSLLTKI